MAGHEHSDDGHHPHVMSIPALLATGFALLVLTIFTVTVTSWDFGYKANLIVAMAIATVKAIIVCLFFMHLLYDKKFNLIILVGSVACMLLFFSITMLDSGQYQDDLRITNPMPHEAAAAAADSGGN